MDTSTTVAICSYPPVISHIVLHCSRLDRALVHHQMVMRRKGKGIPNKSAIALFAPPPAACCRVYSTCGVRCSQLWIAPRGYAHCRDTAHRVLCVSTALSARGLSQCIDHCRFVRAWALGLTDEPNTKQCP